MKSILLKLIYMYVIIKPIFLEKHNLHQEWKLFFQFFEELLIITSIFLIFYY